MELLRRARLQAPDARGVRPTRMVIVRNTLQQLKQTCLADIMLWLAPICTYRVSESTIYLRFPLPDGTTVQSDWMLVPLDTKQDQQRLLSLNLTGAWVSEFREIDISLIDPLCGRLGRFPAKAIVHPTWQGLVAETNPPDEDSDWYTALELDRPSGWAFFRQPGGQDPGAENVENLPVLPDGTTYYDNLVVNNNEDWCRVHVHAQYGKSLSGQAVFRASFRPDFHIVSEDDLTPPSSHIPLMIGQDFGRTPASLVGQVDVRGRLVIYDEVTSDDMGIEQFSIRLLRPLLYERYLAFSVFMVADPKGRDKSQLSEVSAFDVLKRLGFDVHPAPTNSVEPRIRAVEELLLRQVDGGPQLVVSSRCSTLVHAMRYWYRYRRKRTGRLEDRPEKTHPWSDVADCLQYMCMSLSANHYGRVMARKQNTAPRPTPPITGWT